MPSQHTQHVMDDYFTALGTNDFVRFFTRAVTWTTMENGAELLGPLAVQGGIIGLHARMSQIETRQLVVSGDSAYLEGSWAADGAPGRSFYCVAYDLSGAQISAMRAYGPLAAIMPHPGP